MLALLAAAAPAAIAVPAVHAAPALIGRPADAALERAVAALLDPRADGAPAYRQAALEALAQEPAPAVVEVLRAATVGAGSLTARTAERAMEVLGALGDSAGLDLLLELGARARSADAGDGELSATAAAALREALLEVLARDPYAWRELDKVVYFAEPAVLRTVVQAAGAAPCAQGVDLLTKLLGWKDECDLGVLAQLHRAVEALPPDDVSADARARIRACLSARAPHVRADAAGLVGKLRDLASLDLLVELLADSQRPARDGARSALRALSGADVPGGRDAWAAYVAAERDWIARELPVLAAAARSGDRAGAVRALGACSGHRLFREEVAAAVATALENPEPAVRRVACSALARLGAPCARAALEARLADPSEDVRAAAAAALATLGVRHDPVVH